MIYHHTSNEDQQLSNIIPTSPHTEETNKTLSYGWFWVRYAAFIIDIYCLQLIIPIFFNIYFYLKDGDSIGYKLMWLKILDATTREKPSGWQLLGRFFAKILSIWPLWLGCFWVGWDKKKQWWHDKIAKTVVVQYRKSKRGDFFGLIFLFILLVILSSLSK